MWICDGHTSLLRTVATDIPIYISKTDVQLLITLTNLA